MPGLKSFIGNKHPDFYSEKYSMWIYVSQCVLVCVMSLACIKIEWYSSFYIDCINLSKSEPHFGHWLWYIPGKRIVVSYKCF